MGAIADAIQSEAFTSAEMAEKIIRSYCGWHVAPVEQQTLTVDQHRTSSMCFLPTMRIVGLHRVTNRRSCGTWQEIPLCDLGHSGVTHSKAGMLEWRCGKFCRGLGAVEACVTHGFDVFDIPDVVAVAQALAKRIENDNGVRSQSVNGASVSYFGSETGEGRGAGLLATEKAILDRYRLNGEVQG